MLMVSFPGAIVFKLLWTQKQLRQLGVSTHSNLRRWIISVLVESAALYSLNHLLYAVLYEVKSNAENIPAFMASVTQ